MKKYTLLALSLVTIVGLVGLSSCSKDDPAPRPRVSFERSTQTFNEDAGVVEVNVVLDQAAGEDVTVDFDVDGSALEGSFGTTGTDYEITSGSGEIEIKKGQTSAAIELRIKDDAVYESDETIAFEITNVSSSNVDITDDNTITITIANNDSKIKATFVTTTKTVFESEHTVDIQVQLDQAPATDVTITYALSGSAVDSVTAASSDPVKADDYAIRSIVSGQEATPGELVIKAGQTTGTIRVFIYSDFIMEDAVPSTNTWDPETIVLTLTEGPDVIPGTSKDMTISVKQEDGKAIVLFWDESYTTVDMDLFLWIEPEDPETFIVAGSAVADYDGPELVFIPAGIKNVSFGVTYNYYEGNVEPMNFESQFIDFQNLVFESLANRDVFEGQYTLENVNAWQNASQDVLIEQTFDIDEDGAYVNISTIATPATGSRVKALRSSKPFSIDKQSASRLPRAARF